MKPRRRTQENGRGTPGFHRENPLASRRSASQRAMSRLQDCFGGLPTKADCDTAYEMAFTGSGDNFRSTYLAAECFSKFDPGDGTTRIARENEAEARFTQGEQQCKESNRRLIWDPYPSQTIERVIRTTQCIVADTLGDFCLDEFILVCNHGSGATNGLSRSDSSPENKWLFHENTVTTTALPLALALHRYLTGSHKGGIPRDVFGPYPLSDYASFIVVDCDVLDSVNKNMESNRVIGKGPTMNVFFQKGIGKMHRRRLQRKGLLHKSAQQHHQRLAKIASVTGHLATMDLKNASSTICYAGVELVYAKAPVWFHYMQATRVNRWKWKDNHGSSLAERRGRYEMFSAMGNGFTFEMETLMFWALTKAVCLVLGLPTHCEAVSVYGDDIICPVAAVPLLREVFSHMGFTFNARKSFWDGPFRESCGGHYYNGEEVTPFYIKHPPATVIDLINLHNKVSLWLARGRCHDPTLEAVLRVTRAAVPKKHWGPPGLQGTLWSPWHLTGAVWDRHCQSWKVTALRYASTTQVVTQDGAAMAWAWSRRNDVTKLLPNRFVPPQYWWRETVEDELSTEGVTVVDKGLVKVVRLYFDSQRFNSAEHEAFLAPMYLLSS